MRILLDECVNPRLRHAFFGHQVTTVAEVDWLTLSDKQLLKLAEGHFDLFITLDQGFEFQQNLKKSRLPLSFFTLKEIGWKITILF